MRMREKANAIADELSAIKVAAGCADCGYRKFACALDFDHRPGEIKLFPISRAAAHNRDAVMKEVAKCDILCATHHRERTYLRGTYDRMKVPDAPSSPH